MGKTLVKVLISLILLSILWTKVDKASLVENIKGININFLPLIVFFILGNYIVSSMRWKKLLGIYEGVEHISLFMLVKLYFIGSFFNNFLPTSIGGDVYKAFRLGKYINDQSKAFASTFMERFSGVVILALLASVGLITTYRWAGLGIFVLFCMGVVMGLFTLSLLGKKIKKIGKFIDALKAYRGRKDIVSYALVTSVFVQLFSILTQHFIFISLGYNIPLTFSLFAFPVIILASFLIPSQNSFGVQDALYAGFFSQVGVSVEGAFSASIVFHLIRLVVSLLGGLFYAIEK